MQTHCRIELLKLIIVVSDVRGEDPTRAAANRGDIASGCRRMEFACFLVVFPDACPLRITEANSTVANPE